MRPDRLEQARTRRTRPRTHCGRTGQAPTKPEDTETSPHTTEADRQSVYRYGCLHMMQCSVCLCAFVLFRLYKYVAQACTTPTGPRDRKHNTLRPEVKVPVHTVLQKIALPHVASRFEGPAGEESLTPSQHPEGARTRTCVASPEAPAGHAARLFPSTSRPGPASPRSGCTPRPAVAGR